MASRASRIIRRARAAAKSRGLSLERLLPAAEAVAGVLVGLVLGTIVWGVVKSRVLRHRAAIMISVAVEGGREQGGAAMVTARVKGAAFQKEWKSLADEAGLTAERKLDARVVTVSRPDGKKYERVMLTCEGLPGPACRRALVAVRDRVVEMKGLELTPRDWELEKERVRKEIDALEDRMNKAGAEKRRRRAKPSEVQEKEQREAAVKAAEEKVAGKSQRLAKTAAGEGAKRKEMEAILARLKAAPGGGRLTRSQLGRRRRELEGLAKMLGAQALEDSTEQHPVRARMAAIRAELELDALPDRVRELERDLKIVERDRAAVREAQGELLAAKGELEKFNNSHREDVAGRNRVDRLLNRLAREKGEKEAELGELEALNPLKISASATGELEYHPPAYGWVFALIGTALGLLLALLAHRKILPLITVIEDEESMADRLRVPVLGVVPGLVMLEHR
ncbi:MAG: hypothetical protein ACYTGB_05465 [Planctomycetota bacterium]